MIIFRRLRQKLITEGQLARYLAYAAGEIVLVVVGILIALEINNAEIARSERVQEKAYIAALHRDLREDINNIEIATNGNKVFLKGLNSLLGMLASFDDKADRDRSIYLHSLKFTYWYLSVEFSDITLSQLRNSGDFQLIHSQPVALGLLKYDQGIEACKGIYVQLESYFHVQEQTQKQIFNLSLGKKAYEFIEQDFNNMLAPMEAFDQLVNEGDYMVSTDPLLINNYYNDVLFYRTTINNAVNCLSGQNQSAQSLIQLIDAEYPH